MKERSSLSVKWCSTAHSALDTGMRAASEVYDYLSRYNVNNEGSD